MYQSNRAIVVALRPLQFKDPSRTATVMGMGRLVPGDDLYGLSVMY